MKNIFLAFIIVCAVSGTGHILSMDREGRPLSPLNLLIEHLSNVRPESPRQAAQNLAALRNRLANTAERPQRKLTGSGSSLPIPINSKMHEEAQKEITVIRSSPPTHMIPPVMTAKITYKHQSYTPSPEGFSGT